MAWLASGRLMSGILIYWTLPGSLRPQSPQKTGPLILDSEEEEFVDKYVEAEDDHIITTIGGTRPTLHLISTILFTMTMISHCTTTTCPWICRKTCWPSRPCQRTCWSSRQCRRTCWCSLPWRTTWCILFSSFSVSTSLTPSMIPTGERNRRRRPSIPSSTPCGTI